MLSAHRHEIPADQLPKAPASSQQSQQQINQQPTQVVQEPQLVAAARTLGLTVHTGITASSDTFYPGQERYDTVSGYVRRDLQGSAEEWARLHVLNYEMEGATLFTQCATNGWRAGMVAGVLVNRGTQEIPDDAVHDQVEENAVRTVVEAARHLAA